MTSGIVPERKYMDEENIKWRQGKPDYDLVNVKYLKEKIKNHPEGSLEKIVENIVKTWEMEYTHKLRAEDFRTVVQDKFTISVNGGQKFTLRDSLELGSYNILLKDCVLYKSSVQTLQSSNELFRGAMPGGFAWELTELFSGPPVVMFKWRHWGTWEGKYMDTNPTGETIELYGACVAEVDEDLRIVSVEVFYDPTPMLAIFTGFNKTGLCPFSKS